ncbi:NTP transferase domain-containing protein [Bradyrhizobium septentrionale]|uniref:NTP transferase domain-containing protein n=1 Tax=Bradyrhizobium septentrionale TaxID=1404411 RepID=UPI00159641E5|nr:NTP transferase domain-containing protein [Bradyrhizobium septentrionale]UGY26640.1 NTP transferase domain-containing protein [Bradyrhizobium septentrionale]
MQTAWLAAFVATARRDDGNAMKDVAAVLLAAGRSSRMGPLNKLTMTIGGRPMIWHALQNLRGAGISRVIAIIGHDRDSVKKACQESLVDAWEVQEEQLGTGHAAALAIPAIGSAITIAVLFGDCPFLDADIVRRTLETHRDSSASMTIVTARLHDPRELGRIRRRHDGAIERVADGRIDQNVLSERGEVFAGLSVWQREAFCDVLPRLPYRKLPNGRNEQNLPDAVEILVAEGKTVVSFSDISEHDAIAPNDPMEFDTADAYVRTKVRARLKALGVEIQDPQTVIADYDVEVGRGTKIRRNVHLLDGTRIGERCEIGPDTTLRDCVVADGCTIGRGSWTSQTFSAGTRASDRLAGEQRYFRKPHFLIPVEPRYCFVILPFHEPYLSLLKNVIRPTVQRRGFDCFTANRAAPGAIPDDIWESLNRATLIIAEISEDNLNVWYELGLAHALNKNVIALRRATSEPQHLPFDIAHQRVLMYEPDKGNLQGLLNKWLSGLKGNHSHRRPPK